MTTSGVTIYQLDRNTIITTSLRKLGVIAEGQTPSTEDFTNGTISLNALIAEFRGLGMPLWARKQYTFTPVTNTAVYDIGIGKTLNTAYPIHVLQAYRQDGTNTTKIEMEVIPNYNFNLYPTTAGGTPIQLSYQPFINYGQISIWPTPDASAAANSTVTIIYQSPFEYFNSSTDTMAFPEEWYNAIIYKLAVLLAPEWQLPLPDRSALKDEAKEHLDRVLENGGEDGSWFLQPHRREM